MTVDELDLCFAVLMAAWPHAVLPPETFALGHRVLVDHDAAVLKTAIEEFFIEGREFPPPMGLLARRAAELEAELRGERVPDANEALAEVYTQISRVGYYGTPQWSSPAIGHAVAAFGGWEAVCHDDNPEAFRAHFRQLYETYRAQAQREALPAPSRRELVASRALPADPGRLDPGSA